MGVMAVNIYSIFVGIKMAKQKVMAHSYLTVVLFTSHNKLSKAEFLLRKGSQTFIVTHLRHIFVVLLLAKKKITRVIVSSNLSSHCSQKCTSMSVPGSVTLQTAFLKGSSSVFSTFVLSFPRNSSSMHECHALLLFGSQVRSVFYLACFYVPTCVMVRILPP